MKNKFCFVLALTSLGCSQNPQQLIVQSQNPRQIIVQKAIEETFTELERKNVTTFEYPLTDRDAFAKQGDYYSKQVDYYDQKYKESPMDYWDKKRKGALEVYSNFVHNHTNLTGNKEYHIIRVMRCNPDTVFDVNFFFDENDSLINRLNQK